MEMIRDNKNDQWNMNQEGNDQQTANTITKTMTKDIQLDGILADNCETDLSQTSPFFAKKHIWNQNQQITLLSCEKTLLWFIFNNYHLKNSIHCITHYTVSKLIMQVCVQAYYASVCFVEVNTRCSIMPQLLSMPQWACEKCNRRGIVCNS